MSNSFLLSWKRMYSVIIKTTVEKIKWQHPFCSLVISIQLKKNNFFQTNFDIINYVHTSIINCIVGEKKILVECIYFANIHIYPLILQLLVKNRNIDEKENILFLALISYSTYFVSNVLFLCLLDRMNVLSLIRFKYFFYKLKITVDNKQFLDVYLFLFFFSIKRNINVCSFKYPVSNHNKTFVFLWSLTRSIDRSIYK